MQFLTRLLLRRRAGSEYSLRLRAVLEVTHSTDGFGLLAGVTVAFMEHLGVAFLSTPVLGVLEAFKEANVEGIRTIAQQIVKYPPSRMNQTM